MLCRLRASNEYQICIKNQFVVAAECWMLRNNLKHNSNRFEKKISVKVLFEWKFLLL